MCGEVESSLADTDYLPTDGEFYGCCHVDKIVDDVRRDVSFAINQIDLVK